MATLATTRLRDGYADLADVRLHYVETGEGPLVVLLHGFPEFWLSWRFQIPALAACGCRVVAPDMRGYNLSSRPAEVAAYDIRPIRSNSQTSNGWFAYQRPPIGFSTTSPSGSLSCSASSSPIDSAGYREHAKRARELETFSPGGQAKPAEHDLTPGGQQ